MRKSILSGIMMLAAACMITSCGPKTPEPVKLGNSELTAHAVLQDKAKKTFVWGVKNKAGQQVLDNQFIAPPTAFEEFFIGERSDGQVVFDNSGSTLVEGQNCTIKTFRDTRCISYSLAGASSLYLIDKGLVLPEKDKMLFQPDLIFYLSGENVGVLNYGGKDILPAPQKEIIYLTVNKKVKAKGKTETQTSNYYAAQDDKGWNLYGSDGKLVKKLAKWQIKKYQKGATKDAELGKLSYNTLTAL